MRSFKVNVGISNRHVHLTKEVYEALFHDECVPQTYISQKGEFATNHFVTLEGPRGSISKVRVMGPCRSYNQVELAYSDAFILGINPPVRKSGDLAGSASVTVSYEGVQIFLEESTILAQSHIHMNLLDAKKYGVKDGEVVIVRINNLRSGTIDASIKVKDNGVLDFHIDRDQANAFLLNNGDIVDVFLGD